jgi:hypothetical protein
MILDRISMDDPGQDLDGASLLAGKLDALHGRIKVSCQFLSTIKPLLTFRAILELVNHVLDRVVAIL